MRPSVGGVRFVKTHFQSPREECDPSVTTDTPVSYKYITRCTATSCCSFNIALVASRAGHGGILHAVQAVGYPEDAEVLSWTYDRNQHTVIDPDRRVAPKAKPDGNPTQSDTYKAHRPLSCMHTSLLCNRLRVNSRFAPCSMCRISVSGLLSWLCVPNLRRKSTGHPTGRTAFLIYGLRGLGRVMGEQAVRLKTIS